MQKNGKRYAAGRIKRPTIVLNVDQELLDRLRRVAASVDTLRQSDICRIAIDEKLSAMEEAIDAGKSFAVKRPNPTIEIAAAI